jgi:uncharacterized protein GlcG (DUF336 family)
MSRQSLWTFISATALTLCAASAFAQLPNPYGPSITGENAKKAAAAALAEARKAKALQDVLAAGGDGLRLLALQGAVPVEGGLPILMDGKIVGAIGLSGGTSQQDGQCAKVGADVIK